MPWQWPPRSSWLAAAVTATLMVTIAITFDFENEKAGPSWAGLFLLSGR